MSKEKRVTWWKMFSHQRAAVESVGDKAAGAGLKATFRYFDGEDIPDGSLSPQAFTVFCVIRPYIDEARRDFEESAKNGKRGAEARWGKNTTPTANDSPPIGCHREAEKFYEEHFEHKYGQEHAYSYAVCLMGVDDPVGYVNVDTDDSHDFGYGLRREFWHRGIMTQARGCN